MAVTKLKPKLLCTDNSFCPGCGHGLISRHISAALEELEVIHKSVGVVAVGCSCLLPESMDGDWIQAQHGRAAAVAVGVKKVRNNRFVFTYQGDGDAASIGIAETLYTAYRNEKVTTFFINNGVFGMTGGQMAPTTLEGQKTTTSQHGRNIKLTGQPFKLAEMLATFHVGYVARGSLANAKEISKTKQYIKRAIQCQLGGYGYSFVEILSPCPTNWHMEPLAAYSRLSCEISDVYQLGELIKEEF